MQRPGISGLIQSIARVPAAAFEGAPDGRNGEVEEHLSRNRKVKQADLASYLGLENERRVRELFDKGVNRP